MTDANVCSSAGQGVLPIRWPRSCATAQARLWCRRWKPRLQFAGEVRPRGHHRWLPTPGAPRPRTGL